jgi:hypothetical protein
MAGIAGTAAQGHGAPTELWGEKAKPADLAGFAFNIW